MQSQGDEHLQYCEIAWTAYLRSSNSMLIRELKDRLAENLVVVFVVSTTGQGELPANSLTFWKSLLRKRLNSSHLKKLYLTAFGLGDSSYPK